MTAKTSSCEAGADELRQAALLTQRLEAATASREWPRVRDLDLAIPPLVDALIRSVRRGALEPRAAALALQRLQAVHQRATAGVLDARDAVAAEIGSAAEGRRGARSYLESAACG